MTSSDPYAAFRLNLEQQKKRAKELLRDAKAFDANALHRIAHHNSENSDLNLAAAQHCIARELRFTHWAALKHHIAAMQHQREQLSSPVALDDDMKTMHIRCGHDIQPALLNAGLRGDFNLQIDPFVQGPVTNGDDWLEQRANFICEAFGKTADFTPTKVLEGCRDEGRRLNTAITDYERVVLWFELDAHDQLILLRCLAWFADHGMPARLELVDAADFPGSQRFLGLGQLPPEALRLLWALRRVLQREHVKFAHVVWQAYRSEDPRALSQFMTSGTPLLPTLAPALRRQLQELPSPFNGLGLTQQQLLQTLDGLGRISVARLIGETFRVRDAYSGIGDAGLDYELVQIERTAPLFKREHNGSMRTDFIEITDVGRQVLTGQRNWLSFDPPPRWIGGVCIKSGQRNWHWDSAQQKPVLI